MVPQPGEVQILNAIAHSIFRGEGFGEKNTLRVFYVFMRYFSHQRRGLGAGTSRTACVSNIRRHRLKEWRTGG